MRLLLDTRILIWTLSEPEKIPSHIRDEIESAANNVLFSTVSIWEIGIKAALERPNFRFDPQDIIDEAAKLGFDERTITSKLAITASRLPLHHRDPFDRMLVAQAMFEPAKLITAEKILAKYSELVDVI